KPAGPLAVEFPVLGAVVGRAHAIALGLVGIEGADGAAAAAAVGVSAAAEPAGPLAGEGPVRRAFIAAEFEVGDRPLTGVAGRDQREREAEGDQDRVGESLVVVHLVGPLAAAPDCKPWAALGPVQSARWVTNSRSSGPRALAAGRPAAGHSLLGSERFDRLAPSLRSINPVISRVATASTS